MQQDDIRWYQFHRRLSLFPKAETRRWTPLPPAEIERELRPFMYQQARPGDPGPMFDGHFERGGFRLQVPKFDKRFRWPIWLAASYEPTCDGTFMNMKQEPRHSWWLLIILLAGVASALVAAFHLQMRELLCGGAYGLIASLHLANYAIYRRNSRRSIDYIRRFLIFVLIAQDRQRDARS